MSADTTYTRTYLPYIPVIPSCNPCTTPAPSVSLHIYVLTPYAPSRPEDSSWHNPFPTASHAHGTVPGSNHTLSGYFASHAAANSPLYVTRNCSAALSTWKARTKVTFRCLTRVSLLRNDDSLVQILSHPMAKLTLQSSL